MERSGKGKTRSDLPGVSSIPIALHPSFLHTDDSGQVLTVPPNRHGSNFPCRFRRKLTRPPFARHPKFIGNATGILMAAAPLPERNRISDSEERSQIC